MTSVSLYAVEPWQLFKLTKVGLWIILTILPLWTPQLLQFLYFTLAFVNDVVGTNTMTTKKQSTIQKVRDYFFSTVALTIGCVSISICCLAHTICYPHFIFHWFQFFLNTFVDICHLYLKFQKKINCIKNLRCLHRMNIVVMLQ